MHFRLSSVEERAQKQVTRMSSWSTEDRRSDRLRYMASPVPVVKLWIVDVLRREEGVVA